MAADGPLTTAHPHRNSLASEVDCDLRGVRLTVLRIVLALSKPQLAAQIAGCKPLTRLLRELDDLAHISLAIDAAEPLLRSLTEPTALLTDPVKLERIFVVALDVQR